MEEKNLKVNPITKKNDYIREITQLRMLENPEGATDNTCCTVEGKAITYEDKTELTRYHDSWLGKDVIITETITRGAFAGANTKPAFFKYNHDDGIMVMGRTKNNTLRFEEREDGVYIQCDLPDTTSGRDLATLIKRGDIDKMSFAFVPGEERKEEIETDEALTINYFVDKLKTIYDVSAVPLPAYENTEIYARRQNEVEAELRHLEEQKREKDKIKLKIKIRSLM